MDVMSQVHSPVISGMRAKIIGMCFLLNIFLFATWQLKNPFKVFEILRRFKTKRKKLHGFSWITKYVKSQNRYFFSENIPGWPSNAFNTYLKGEISRATRKPEEVCALQTIIFAVSSRCPFKCSHCLEWNNLASHENLSVEDLKIILNKIGDLGLRHVQLSGGEPLERFDDLLTVLNSARKDIDFWLATSGFNLTPEKAFLLKKAGIVGAIISLDHWDENFHNEFRNNNKAFYWAREAVLNCGNVGMLTSLSLCATKTFISDENLRQYLNLAKEWGACFIRILEPREAGHFKGQDIMLKAEHISVLEDFFKRVNFSAQYRHFPIIMYPAYHQRKIGCFGAGNSYLYIDSMGDIHACPFCQRKAGNAKHDPLIPVIARLKRMGCQEYKMNIYD
jgi:MoaA/NifB/PqqE/SkfB family radical SAM enzyme